MSVKQNKVSDLESLGFAPAATVVEPRMIISVSGFEKCGKTHFALTAPKPIAMINTDIGTEGVVQKFGGDGAIFTMEVDMNPATAQVEWEKVKSAWYGLLSLPRSKCTTIVVDTATEIWELLRLARFGKLTQVMPYQYGPVNAEFRTMLKAAYGSDKNVVLIHKRKAVYINDKRTKDSEPAGFGDIPFLVQANLEVWREKGGGDFGVTIHDCRHKAELAGEELVGGIATFEFVLNLMLG